MIGLCIIWLLDVKNNIWDPNGFANQLEHDLLNFYTKNLKIISCDILGGY